MTDQAQRVRHVRIGSRSSPLARAQVAESLAGLRDLLGPDTVFETTWFGSPGDRDLSTPLGDAAVSDDFFTRDLDDALRRNEVDLTIHSAKDLPQQIPPGLCVAALRTAHDIRDCLVVRTGLADADIRTIGTSSPRREEEIRRLLPHAFAKPIRGTIQSRLAQVDGGEYDAVLMAACALKRLGLGHRIGRYLHHDPAPQQGRLAFVTRADDHALLAALQPADVRQHSGMIVLSEPAAGAAGSEMAGILAAADRILLERGVNAASVPAGARTAVVASDELRARALHEAETGVLVAVLGGSGRDLAADARMLREWNLRVAVYDAGGAGVDAGPPTLFTGLDPSAFLRHGPFILHPLIEVRPRPLETRTDFIRRELAKAAGVIFPSRPAVRAFVEALDAAGGLSALAGRLLLAVGPGTAAEMIRAGLNPDLTGDGFEGLESLPGRLGSSWVGRYLYPTSSASPRAERVQQLAAEGIELVPAVFYDNTPTVIRPLPDTPFARVLFTSPSTVRAYFERHPEERSVPRTWLAIGPATARALADAGLTPVKIHAPRIS